MNPARLEYLEIAVALFATGAVLIWAVGNRIQWAPIAGGVAIAIAVTLLFLVSCAP